MKVLISGYLGHMGAILATMVKDGVRGAVLAGGVDKTAMETDRPLCVKDFADASTDVDCIIDFSHHSLTAELLAFAKENRLPLVLCTTGQTEEEMSLVRAAAREIPIFFSANMSVGIALLAELAQKVAKSMPDAEIEIVEKHHDRKLDAPSGTALLLADAIRKVRPSAETVAGRSGHGKRTPEEIGIHAIRMGNIVGEHEIMIGTPAETITLKHEAHSRALFAEGALAAAAYLVRQKAGLYDMQAMLSK